MKIILLLLYLWAGSDARTPDNKRLTSNLDEAVSFLKKAMQKIENANDEVLQNGKGVSSTDSKTENRGGGGRKEEKTVSDVETKSTSTGNPKSTNNTWKLYTDSKLIVATSEDIFEYDFLSQSWKRHKVTSSPKAIYFVNDSLTWVSETKVGIYNDNFEAETLVKLQYPSVPIAVDRESGVTYLKDIRWSTFFRVDVEKRKILENFYLPSSFSYLDGMVRQKKLHMLVITKGRIHEVIVPIANPSHAVTGRIRLPICSNATFDPFRDNCVLYVSNLQLMEFCVNATLNAKSKKLAAIPGPIKSMQVNEESVLLVGHADVYIYNRSSAEVKTLPRPANLNNNFTCGLIYKKPKDARYSEEHMEGSGRGDENRTPYEYDYSETYGSSGDYGTSGDYGSSGNYAKSETYGTDTTRKEKRNKEATVKDKTTIQRHLTKDKMIRTKDLRAQLVRNNGDLGPKVMDDRGMKNGMIFRRDRMSRKITRDARSGHMAMDGEGTELVNDGRMDSDPTTIVMNGEGFGSMEQRPMSAELPADGVMGIRKESMRHGRRSSRVGFKPKSSEKFQRAGPYP